MVSNGYGGCSYVRMLLPAFHNGFRSNKASTASEMASPAEAVAEMRKADVVVFHRPENKTYHNLAKLLKADGKKIVLDNDDTFRIDTHPLAQFTPEAVEVELKNREKSIVDFMKMADMVTTSTETLAREYRENHHNVIVLPNCVDPIDWCQPIRNKTDVVRIGVVGSAAFEYDYLHIKPVLRKLSKRKDVQLIMFGLGSKEHRKANPNVTKAFKEDYKFWDSINIEHFPWCPMDEYQDTLNRARLDMMLIPRKDNYFNRCKSNIKFLEASMLEIPVIAQSFTDGPYEEIVDYKTGVKVTNNKHWETDIELLIGNKKLRRDIGKRAKQYVLNNYNIEDHAQRWEDAYKSLYENNSKI
jgi:glycosyltransferase involved in cell wall biosynthesis